MEERLNKDPISRIEMQPSSPVLSFPEPQALALSLRASALVFEDPRSKDLFERIERIAPSEATVLITGETGTGKELIARPIHALSQCHGGPFAAVNCTALSDWKTSSIMRFWSVQTVFCVLRICTSPHSRGRARTELR